MKIAPFKTKLVLILLTLLATSSAKSDSVIYKWTDENGKVHFDNNGANSHRESYVIKPTLQSIKWEDAEVNFSKTTTKANKQQLQYNKQAQKECVKTNKRITNLKKKLVTPLVAQKFDAYQSELRKLRWTKRKVC